MGENQTMDDRIKEMSKYKIRPANKHGYSIVVAKIWGEIKGGRVVLVDEDGRIVESEDEAEWELRPDYRKRDETGDLPVVAIPVGRPESPYPSKEWVEGGTVYKSRNGMIVVHRDLSKDVLSEDDALDCLLNAANYCDSAGHSELAREIEGIYQQLGAAEYGAHTGN